jgi:hypothetical protein
MDDREQTAMRAVCGACGSARIKFTDLTGDWNVAKQKPCVDRDSWESSGACLDCGDGDYVACDIVFVPVHDKVL